MVKLLLGTSLDDEEASGGHPGGVVIGVEADFGIVCALLRFEDNVEEEKE